MKKPLHKLWVALLLALLSPTALTAQRVLWDVDFDFRFDNREYGNPSRMIAPSETIFGAKLIPIIGVEWNDGHALFSGAVLPATFGNPGVVGLLSVRRTQSAHLVRTPLGRHKLWLAAGGVAHNLLRNS